MVVRRSDLCAGGADLAADRDGKAGNTIVSELALARVEAETQIDAGVPVGAGEGTCAPDGAR